MKSAIALAITILLVVSVAVAGPSDKKAQPDIAAKADSAQVVEIEVTKAGFVPAEVKVKVGRPLKLVVTRTIDRTCAKDIVIKDYGIKAPLPLNQTVEVTFTPNKLGRVRFACAMNMIAGVIIVE